MKKQKDCEADLVKAEPALTAAQVHITNFPLVTLIGFTSPNKCYNLGSIEYIEQSQLN